MRLGGAEQEVTNGCYWNRLFNLLEFKHTIQMATSGTTATILVNTLSVTIFMNYHARMYTVYKVFFIV